MLWSGSYVLATAWDEFGVWPDGSQRWPSRDIEALPAERVSETRSDAHAGGPRGAGPPGNEERINQSWLAGLRWPVSAASYTHCFL